MALPDLWKVPAVRLQYIIGRINGLQFTEKVDLNDVLIPAGPYLDPVMLSAAGQGNLLKEEFYPARLFKGFLKILSESCPICLIPVGDADHLPDILSFTAEFRIDDDAVSDRKAPVIALRLFDTQEVGGVMVLPDNRRV